MENEGKVSFHLFFRFSYLVITLNITDMSTHVNGKFPNESQLLLIGPKLETFNEAGYV